MGKNEKKILLSNKKQLEEMPMQFDSNRDVKPHPSIQRNLATNNTPLKKIPFPKVDPHGVPSNFQELLASERYKEVLEKVKTYTGYQNVGEGEVPLLMQQMMQAFQTVMQLEAQHKTELERLALELVKKEMGVNEGDINFDAKIVGVHQIDTNFNRNQRDSDDVQPDIDNDDENEEEYGDDDREDSPDEPNLDDEDAKVEGQLYNRLKDLNLERAKRRFINAIVQGASKRGHYMYHLVSERLRQITGSDRLLNSYGIMMSVNDLLYWMIPDNYVDNMGLGRNGVDGGAGQVDVIGGPDRENLRGGNNYRPEPHVGDMFGRGMMDTPAGSSEVNAMSDVPVVKARGFCFPVLIHELVKGVMEVLAAHGIPKDSEMSHEVIELEDVLQKEFWDFRLGPAIWNRLRNQLPEDLLTDENKKELQNFLFAEFFALPAKEFLVFAREVISGSRKGARLMQELCDELVERLNTPDDADYDYGQSNFRRDLDDLSKDMDDDGLDDLLGSLGITRSDDDE
jgi:hypothetical protein